MIIIIIQCPSRHGHCFCFKLEKFQKTPLRDKNYCCPRSAHGPRIGPADGSSGVERQILRVR